ncbi:hypothetical protein GOV08_03165 [Candidatus Woesearchaeota archaeon]|nr:hypothetical protein [Candidatus Woesearchaeota archaeon]
MKAAAICIPGLEKVCEKELLGLGAKKTNNRNGYVVFETKDIKSLCKITYISRTSSRVISLLLETKIDKDLDKTRKILEKKKIEISEWINEDKSFKVVCERIGKHDFKSTEFEAMLGEVILNRFTKKPKVLMDNPDIIIYSYINGDACVFGVDFSGFDMSKRDYHIFTNKTSIKGNLAASMVLFSDVKKGNHILDPNCSSGTIPIEAALISSGVSVHSFRKDEFAFNKLVDIKIEDRREKIGLKVDAFDPLLANVKSSSKNAKVAGLKKGDVNFSRADFEWLDTKLDKESVDRIITKLVSPSKLKPAKEVEKLYKELFYQAQYVLKKSGFIVALVLDDKLLLEIAKKYKLKKTSSINIQIGRMSAIVVAFKKI